MFSLKTRKNGKLLRFTVFIALVCLFFQGVFLLYVQKIGILTKNALQSLMTFSFFLHFLYLHHHIELFDYMIYMISERIQEFYAEQQVNFFIMHCSCDIRNVILSTNSKRSDSASFHTGDASIIFLLPLSVDVNVVSDLCCQIMYFETSIFFQLHLLVLTFFENFF